MKDWSHEQAACCPRSIKMLFNHVLLQQASVHACRWCISCLIDTSTGKIKANNSFAWRCT